MLFRRLLMFPVWTVLLPAALSAQETRPTVRVGFVTDEPNARATEFRALVQSELDQLTENDFDVLFPSQYDLTGDGTVASVSEALSRLANNPQIDVVITTGMLGSQIAGSRAPWPRPVIASVIIDAELQGLPFDSGTSGTPNFTYVTVPAPIGRDLQTFRQIVAFNTVDFLIDEQSISAFGDLTQLVLEDVAEVGVALRLVPVGLNADSALSRIPNDAEAIYVAPLERIDSTEFAKLIAGINARRLPSFAFDGDDVPRGVMASLGAIDVPRLARRVAIHAHRILLGDDPSMFSVNFVPGEDLVINMRTVRETGIIPPIGLILEARRLFEDQDDIGREITLQSVMEEAIQSNLSLAIQEQAVVSGAEDVQQARANLLPSLETSVTGTTIARSLAEASSGQNPQHNIDGSVRLQQLIFSEDALANVSIQNSLQRSRDQDRLVTELDVALEAAESYFNFLRAKALEEIQQSNLEVTRTSLRLATIREQIGAAGPAERLRLQSELAQRRADRVDAYAQRYAAEVSLNQVLNRPLDDVLTTPEADVDSRTLIEGNLATEYLADLNRFVLLADFLIGEAFRISPELQSIEASVAAQGRLVRSRGLTYFLPRVALQADVSTNLLKDGAGSTFPTGVTTPNVTDFPWSVGFSATLPLFEGTARGSRRAQASAELSQLQLQRDLTAQRIEQSVRTQLQFAQASLAIVDENETAADAARRSLELVTDSYAEGVVDVVDLLQAQNAALVADRGVANAVYDYLINLKRVERAVGGFELLVTPEERAEFRERLDEYYRNAEARDQ